MTDRPLSEWTHEELMNCGPHFHEHPGVWEELRRRSTPGETIQIDLSKAGNVYQAKTDIHGTNWAEYQRVYKIERTDDHRVAKLFFSIPLEDGQITSLMEYLRTWHP